LARETGKIRISTVTALLGKQQGEQVAAWISEHEGGSSGGG
jgi:hypothetical protein